MSNFVKDVLILYKNSTPDLQETHTCFKFIFIASNFCFISNVVTSILMILTPISSKLFAC